MRQSLGEITREYGPFSGAKKIAGVTYDGRSVWFADGERLRSFDPATGEESRTIDVPAHAGTAYDGEYLYQIGKGAIQKVDPASGRIVSTIPAPGDGDAAGLAWAEGALWVGQYHGRKIHQIDPHTGAILRTIESNRFVTGVTWLGDELWHGTLEDDRSELRHVDAMTGEVLERIALPDGVAVSGLESDGRDQFYCGGANRTVVRAIRRVREK